MKGLEALEDLYEYTSPYINVEDIDEGHTNTCYQVIQKELKAFDIVREMFLNGTDVTKVLLSIYQSKDFEEFQQTHLFANKDKYDLLKEVLK